MDYLLGVGVEAGAVKGRTLVVVLLSPAQPCSPT